MAIAIVFLFSSSLGDSSFFACYSQVFISIFELLREK